MREVEMVGGPEDGAILAVRGEVRTLTLYRLVDRQFYEED